MKNEKITNILEKQNLRELARRITSAGYPIRQPTLTYWKQGVTHPRVDRLQLAKRVLLESGDDEVAEIISELISAVESLSY